jgi:hypothetical protein
LRLAIVWAVVVLAIPPVSPVFAQGAVTSTLSGAVVDESGAVIPGASVTVRSSATGAIFSAVTDDRGEFSIPAMPNGVYSVSVALMGFKTAVLNEVAINAGVPAAVKVVLEVGALEESVVVQGESSAIVQTQTPAVSTTLNIREVSNLPLVSRNALDFVTMLPGVNTPGGNRDSTISGLPQNAINITLDGINVQDNTLKSTDGFFTIVQPRLDAVEEVTLTTAGENAGQGAVQIQFVTRSGTNQLRGSVYHYLRRDALNANTWFNERNNIAKPRLKQDQPGIRVGGPIVIPGLVDGRNKAFFFVNYEEFRQPQDLTRNRTILSAAAQQGVFRYATAAGVQSVNLLALAAAHGHVATPDPIVAKLLADIRTATASTGSITALSDPNIERYSYNLEQRAHNRFPTVRLDYNVSEAHRVMASINYATFLSTPDTLNSREPFFPGFPASGDQTSTRLGVSTSLRSTIGSNKVNELRVGGSGAPVEFFKGMNRGMWGGTGVGNQGGFHLNLNGACCQGGSLSNAAGTPAKSARNAHTLLVENTLQWIKGDHNLSVGASWNQVDIWLDNETVAPTVNFGIVSGDPADAMFNTANFPGASAAQLNAARGLYSIVTGRVSGITGNIRLNERTGRYEYLGRGTQRGRMRELDLFFGDNWRMRSNLSVSYGVRYAIQFPFRALNSSYTTVSIEDAWGVSGLAPGCTASAPSPQNCNLFKPGVLQGRTPEFVQLEEGRPAYGIDWNNVAPRVGVVWTPAIEDGVLRRLVGAPGDTAIRAGWSRSFNREGMANFTDRFGSNPGITITANRDPALGNFGPVPLLLRDADRLGPPPFAETPVYPMRQIITGSLNTFDPDLKVPYSDSWQVGVQRAISSNMAVEVRYVGTRSRDLWTNYNYNEANIVENGFLEEFRAAQGNLQANLAAGRGATFAYTGAPGTRPLPIYLAYFNGLAAAHAGDPSAYTGALWTSTLFINPLARFHPQPFVTVPHTLTAANQAAALDGTAERRANALRAGLPPNFLRANPDVLGGSIVTGNGGYSSYNSIQIELRRRMSHGLQFQASYVYGIEYLSDFFSFRHPRLDSRDTGTEGGVDHAFKTVWVYELPFGRGRRFFGSADGLLHRLIGGWQIHGTGRFQSGVNLDFGNVRLVGMTEQDVKKMVKLRIDDERRVWMLPQDVIENTARAFSVSATSPTGYGPSGPPSGRYFAPANGPDCIEIAQPTSDNTRSGFGDCGARTLVVRGPLFKNVDVSITKIVPLAGRAQVELRFEMLNAFDWVNFLPVIWGGAGTGGTTIDNFEVTSLNGATTSRQMQIVSRVSW